jgi:hypothetical protein
LDYLSPQLAGAEPISSCRLRRRLTATSLRRKVHEELNEISHQQILEMAMPRVRSMMSARAWKCFEERWLRDRPGAVIAAEIGMTDNKAVFVYASRVLKAVRAQCTALAEELGDEPVDWLPRKK